MEGGVDKIPVQFIKTEELSDEDSGYLRLLNDGLDMKSVSYVMDEANKSHKVKMGAFLDAILRANTNRVEEGMAMGGKTLEEVLEKARLIAKWKALGEEQAEKRNKAKIENIVWNLVKKGLNSEEIAEMTELDLTDVLSLREQCKT